MSEISYNTHTSASTAHMDCWRPASEFWLDCVLPRWVGFSAERPTVCPGAKKKLFLPLIPLLDSLQCFTAPRETQRRNAQLQG